MKVINNVDLVDGTLMLGGLAISLQDIQSILSIIIIVIDILWLVGKFLIKFIRYCKDGELTEEEIEDLKNDIYEIKDKTKEDDR